MLQFKVFFKERVFKDAFVKFLHGLAVVGICYLFALSSRGFINAEASVLGVPIDLNTLGLASGAYTRSQAYLLFLVGVGMILISNVSYLVRSWKFDFFFQFVPLLVLNIVHWFVPYVTIPLFPEISTLLVFNLSWGISLRLARTEKDQKLIRSIFGRYVDNQVADAIIYKGEKVEFDGQLRDMTVLFSDIRGFTTLSESLHPKRLIGILSYYLNIMTDVVLNNRGTVDKFIGDAIMAFWNAPTRDRYHTQNAIRTALKMQAKMIEVQTAIPELSNTNIGVGIARGPMVVGNVGGKNRFDYTVLGDTVNLASRLESLTKQYGVGILINEAACEAMDGVIFRQIDIIVVKGKTKPVAIYEPMHANHLNATLKDKYEFALGKMRAGDSRKALEMFQFLAGKGDKPSQVMAERIGNLAQYQQAPKVWQWESK